jgi:leader peptidase (prepilin peptidase) / N-methyltransferase
LTPTAWLVFAGIVGACVGSFLNVVAWRLPRGESLSHPPSRCPGCGKGIRWFDNVPVLAWIFLRGRCRACRTRISPRYPLVEAATAALFLWVAWRHPLPEHAATFAATAALLSALLVVSLIDWDTRLVPRSITTPGIVLGLVCSFLVPALHSSTFLPNLANRNVASFLEGVAGMAAGAGVVLALRFLWFAIFRREGMGLGDVKILAMIGTLLTPLRSLLVLLLGSFVGVVLGSLLRATLGARARTARGRLGTARILAAKTTAARRSRRLFVLGPRPARLTALVSGALPARGENARLDWTVPVDDAFVERPVRLRLEARVVSVSPRGEGRAWVAMDLPSLTDEQDDAVWGFHAARVAIPFGPFLAIAGAIVVMHGQEIEHFLAETWPRWVRGWFGNA